MKTVHEGISLDPVSKDAAFAISGGEHYNEKAKVLLPHWENRPKIRPPLGTGINLVGVVCGRLEAIGLNPDNLRQWVCRCSCGEYEVRTAKALRNPNNFGDRCTKCRNLAFERKDYEFRKTGRQMDVRTL